MKALPYLLLMLFMASLVAAQVEVIDSWPSMMVEGNSINITIETNIASTCKIDSKDDLYENMRHFMADITQKKHNYLTPIVPTGELNYFVRCTDEDYEVMNESYILDFLVERPFLSSTEYDNQSAPAIPAKKSLVSERYWGSINTTKYVAWEIKDEEMAVTKFGFRLNYPVKDLTFIISEKVQTPVDRYAINRLTYRYFEIKNSLPDQSALAKMTISFRVSRDWARNNEVEYSRVSLYYYDDGWHEIKPELIDSETTLDYAYFQALADKATYYAIAISDTKLEAKAENVPTNITPNVTETTIEATTTVAEKPIVDEMPEQNNEKKPFPLDIVLLVVLSLLSITYLVVWRVNSVSRKNTLKGSFDYNIGFKTEDVFSGLKDRNTSRQEANAIIESMPQPKSQETIQELAHQAGETIKEAAPAKDALMAELEQNLTALQVTLDESRKTIENPAEEKAEDPKVKDRIISMCQKGIPEDEIKKILSELNVDEKTISEAYEEWSRKKDFGVKLSKFEDKVLDMYIMGLKNSGRSRHEITDYLKKKGFSTEQIDRKLTIL
jgi:PGF-pre-PGF domain-containing protein